MYYSNGTGALNSQTVAQLATPERLLFSSRSIAEVKESVGRVMKPHSLTVVDERHKLDAKMHFLQLGEVSLSRLTYGTSVEIQPGALEDFFLVQMPLSGHAAIDNGIETIDSSQELASVLSPDDEINMVWKPGVHQFMVRIPRTLVERTLVGVMGHQIDEPIQFELGFNWKEKTEWSKLIPYLVNYGIHADLVSQQNNLILSQLDQLVATCLLSCHKHNYSNRSSIKKTTVRPRHVRFVQDYIEAHLNESITSEQLAAIAGVSCRSLYSGFKNFVGTSPMQYLRDLRMGKIRAELLSGQAQSVTGVALKWGFSHMGRFSAEYKARYGESPSDSLRKA
jgi:AraC-like DNA-binding protein